VEVIQSPIHLSRPIPFESALGSRSWHTKCDRPDPMCGMKETVHSAGSDHDEGTMQAVKRYSGDTKHCSQSRATLPGLIWYFQLELEVAFLRELRKNSPSVFRTNATLCPEKRATQAPSRPKHSKTWCPKASKTLSCQRVSSPKSRNQPCVLFPPSPHIPVLISSYVLQIPENAKLQKETVLSLVKGSTVFINYLGELLNQTSLYAGD